MLEIRMLSMKRKSVQTWPPKQVTGLIATRVSSKMKTVRERN
jgi:hypothetical protein